MYYLDTGSGVDDYWITPKVISNGNEYTYDDGSLHKNGSNWYAPSATSTPDTRSDYEKCADYDGVKYLITGTASKVSLTWQNDENGTQQGDYKVPFCSDFNFFSGDFLYISAQITSESGGSIECFIYDGDSLISHSEASGFASIATCSGSK